MRLVKERDFLNRGVLVVHKDFKKEILQQVKVDLVTVVTDGHDKRTAFVQDADLPGQR